MMSDDINQRLGKIEGLLIGIDKKVDGLEGQITRQDERLRTVERRTFANSVVASGVISIGIAFVKDKIGV